ncbi:MAG: hypothetical protein ACD_46C00159G0006 [uncultured bacterium]|nr:MAG: hypothetical protein ACD_46C00159G0006 [uncultured bacterium]
MKKLYQFICSLFLLIPLSAHAESNNKINFFGYVDGSYNYLYRSNLFTSGTHNRVYDLEQNGLTLQQIYLLLDKLPDQGLGGGLNIIIGRDANEISPAGLNPNVFDIQNIGLTVAQAYLQYSYQSFTLKAGEMLSLAGLEQNNYADDTNFSRSILDGYAQSGIHVGLRATKKFNQQISFIAGVNNGWNSIRQPGRLNTIEFGINYIPCHILSLTIDGSSGQQYLTDNTFTGPTGVRNLLDIFGTLTITDQLNLAMNYDYGVQSKALLPNADIKRTTWQGFAGYLNYLFNDKWRTSFRSEIFSDSDGYRTGVRQNWREITLTLGYLPIKKLEFRGEIRRDFSNVNSFLDTNRINTANTQQSYALNVLYQFA